ncbi:MAG: hypothetical protein JNM70_17975 [Anaerolineae bacterium]|nr:hypothetical protein [Anaerolineae bacterium]
MKKREVEILQLTSQGMTKSEIAITLMLSVETVAWYGRQILKKLEAKNWGEALARGRELGLIPALIPPEQIEIEASASPAEETPIDEPVIQAEEPAASTEESYTEIPVVILPGVVEALAPPLLLTEPNQPVEASPSEEEASVPVHPTAEFEVTGPLPTFDDHVEVTDSTVIAPATYALSDEFDLAGAIPPAAQPTQTHSPQWDHEMLSALAGSSSHPHHGDIDDEEWDRRSVTASSHDLVRFDADADDTGVFGPTEAVPDWWLLSPNAPAEVDSVTDEPIPVVLETDPVASDDEIESGDPSPVGDLPSDETVDLIETLPISEAAAVRDYVDQPIGDEAAPGIIGDDLETDHLSEWSAEAAHEALESRQNYSITEEIDSQPEQEPVGMHTSERVEDEVSAAEGVEPPVGHRAYRPAQHLPVPTGAFIGREQEMRELEQLLSNQRVVHVTGLPGVGKTRLALETAHQLRGEFAGGVHYVYLPNLSQAALQAAVALHLIGYPAAEVEPQGKALLILDHADQTSRPSSIVTELLSARHDLQIIVTSRDWMGINGAAELKVPPLEVPSIHPRKAPNWSSLLESAAMRLFVKVTEQALPGYSLREADATALGHLCGRSQGVPALIEVLAAHLRVYPPPIILMQLDNRLRGMGGGSEPSMQQSLNGILGWSHNLLKRDEQVALAGLSLFVGGWSEETAGAVLSRFVKSPIGEILSQLAHKRFIQVLSSEDERKRYAMSDTVRDFAATKLHQHEHYLDILGAFANAYWTMVENPGSDREQWLANSEAEIDNIRLVLRLAVEHRAAEMLTRMTLGLWPLWEATERYPEADYWFSIVLAQAGQKNQDALGQIRLISANVALRRGQHQQALELLEECLVVYRLSGDRANERYVLSLLRQIMADHAEDDQTNP